MPGAKPGPVGYGGVCGGYSGCRRLSGVPSVCLLVAETGACRLRDDNVSPTPSVGLLLVTGIAPFEYSGDVAALSLVGCTGTTAVSAAFYVMRG